MIKPVLAPAVILAGMVAFGAPAQAQQNDRKLVIYGNDRCPANTICVRAKEEDRYRIPKALRDGPLAPKDQPWGQRASSVSRAGSVVGDGTGSCSSTGSGGWTGCLNRDLKQARDERREANAAAAESPEPKR